ncbi:MAG: pyruvate kinase [archaeon]
MAKTKILATLGPASWDKLEDMIRAGLDGFRINMSHVKEYGPAAKLISDIRKKAPYAFIAADLEGPKIRLGTLAQPLPIEKGQGVKIAPQSECPEGCVPIQVEHVYKHVAPGNMLLINDGAVGLQVTDIKDKIIYTNVLFGMQLESRKGVNIPEAYVPMQFLSAKDKANLDFLVQQGVDYVSASFTQNADNLKELRTHMGDSKIKIIAKIENPEGLKNFDAILEYTDAVMVARGDLGMEIGPIYVPEQQKMMISKCNRAGKMVITATQMLESMMNGLEPKRAEVSDIFNAVLDGTDVVMLSGETSVGQYPVEAIDVMNKTLERAELYFKNSGRSRELADRIIPYLGNTPEDVVSGAVDAAVRTNGIGAIITPTTSGYTTQRVARFRLDVPIIALTPDEVIARQLNAVWGVQAYHAELNRSSLVKESLQYVSANNLIPKETQVVVVSGTKTGTTDTMQIAVVE